MPRIVGTRSIALIPFFVLTLWLYCKRGAIHQKNTPRRRKKMPKSALSSKWIDSKSITYSRKTEKNVAKLHMTGFIFFFSKFFSSNNPISQVFRISYKASSRKGAIVMRVQFWVLKKIERFFKFFACVSNFLVSSIFQERTTNKKAKTKKRNHFYFFHVRAHFK